jgi:hypothetical protein
MLFLLLLLLLSTITTITTSYSVATSTSTSSYPKGTDSYGQVRAAAELARVLGHNG